MFYIFMYNALLHWSYLAFGRICFSRRLIVFSETAYTRRKRCRETLIAYARLRSFGSNACCTICRTAFPEKQRIHKWLFVHVSGYTKGSADKFAVFSPRSGLDQDVRVAATPLSFPALPGQAMLCKLYVL